MQGRCETLERESEEREREGGNDSDTCEGWLGNVMEFLYLAGERSGENGRGIGRWRRKQEGND